MAKTRVLVFAIDLDLWDGVKDRSETCVSVTPVKAVTSGETSDETIRSKSQRAMVS